jgi:hypothetical protein
MAQVAVYSPHSAEVGHLRLFTGQALEEGGNIAHVVVAQLSPQLTRPHDCYCLPQIPGLTRVKVRCGQGNVSERRHFEDIFIARSFGDHEATLVSGRQELGTRPFDHPNGAYMPPPIPIPL